MDTKYTCSGFNAVQAESQKHAATIFANRQAKKEYGKKGYARIVNLNSWSMDNSMGNYDCFIGVDGKGCQSNTTTGHNIHLLVTTEKE
jgi:hypothetical protein